jgi:hypothetical protein
MEGRALSSDMLCRNSEEPECSGGCYPTQAPGGILLLKAENCHGASRVWRGFCHPDTNFIEQYACRGTSLIGAANLSPVTKLAMGTGAVSRYKFLQSCQGSRSES